MQGTDDGYVNDEKQSNHFALQEWTSAFFVSWKMEWNSRFSTRLGSRLEYTDYTTRQYTLGEKTETDFSGCCPTSTSVTTCRPTMCSPTSFPTGWNDRCFLCSIRSRCIHPQQAIPPAMRSWNRKSCTGKPFSISFSNGTSFRLATSV